MLTVLQAGIIPRALGPKTYGDYNFLINFFSQFVQFLEMRSSNFLYNSLSVTRRERNTAAFYLWIVLAVSFATVAITLLAIGLGAHSALWPGQDGLLIFLCALLSLLFWHAELLAKVCDALGFTV
nr:lipopolysaccharide biosynthesis protein [Fibrobacterota bacterium]